ncbi:MAG: (2Fe-2S) ferredoxin domain-containing protein, partial [Candidatus Aminicenantes bacterium]|nr:(2Fe-2S) ferredoxin domain-containing protein [Candidatus Aminicenantes bacterium]
MDEFDTSELDKIRAEVSESQMKQKTCITICGGTGCHAYGCLKVAEAFKEEIKRQNLQNKVDVRTTGCHGFCE